jgi:hypothetical protein
MIEGGFTLTAFLSARPIAAFSLVPSKIDRLMPIVAEIERISSRQICSLESRAKIFDGLSDGYLAYSEKNYG